MSRNAKTILILASWCQWNVYTQTRLDARDVWAFDQLRALAADVIGRGVDGT